MEKPTEQEYRKALEVIRAYHPEKYIETEIIEMEHPFSGNQDAAKVVVKDGYFMLLSPSGEIMPYQLSMKLHDSVDSPLKATCTLHVEFHKIKE